VSDFEYAGTVSSHTTIRVAGNAHAHEAPFVLLLVEGDDGTRRLGRYLDDEPPALDTRVVAREERDGVAIFGPPRARR
jgi:uncharacterized OB-fold protein